MLFLETDTQSLHFKLTTGRRRPRKSDGSENISLTPQGNMFILRERCIVLSEAGRVSEKEVDRAVERLLL